MSQQAQRKSQSGAQRRIARKEAALKKERQKRMMQMVIGASIAAVVVAALLIFLNRPDNGSTADYSGIAFAAPAAVSAGGATPAVASPDTADVNGPATGAVLGDPNAPVTMIIYADFQCPFCGQFAREIQPKIVDDFVRPGKVKLEFREFAFLGGNDLTDDSNESAQAAEAVMCAAEQDAYLPYHDKLYTNQSGENQGAFNDGRLKGFAKDLGLNTDQFNTCLDSGKYEPAIAQMKTEGGAQGITATPMFVINGQVTSLSQQGYDLLKKQLDTSYEQAT
jgi:protein-disulfide isomerase